MQQYIEEYIKILNGICKNNTRVFHIMLPDRSHIIHEQHVKQIKEMFSKYNLKIFDASNCINFDFYDSYEMNQHHFTTKQCWKLMDSYSRMLGFNFNVDDFYEIEKYDNGNDISYHEFKNEQQLEYVDIISGKQFFGDSSILRAFGQDGSYRTDYHRLFRGSHNVCYIRNKSVNNRKLLVVTDSMLIPNIPLFSVYFSEILHIDNRVNVNFKDILFNFKPDVFLSSHQKTGYVDNQYLRKINYMYNNYI